MVLIKRWNVARDFFHSKRHYFIVISESESESEYFTGDTSIYIHSPGPTIAKTSLKWCESSDRILRTFSREDYSYRECIPIPNGVWKETVLINVSSSILHLKCHWMLIPTAPIWRSRVQPPPRSATFFRGDWSWNIFYGHSLPSVDSRRAVVSFWRNNVHNTG